MWVISWRRGAGEGTVELGMGRAEQGKARRVGIRAGWEVKVAWHDDVVVAGGRGKVDTARHTGRQARNWELETGNIVEGD